MIAVFVFVVVVVGVSVVCGGGAETRQSVGECISFLCVWGCSLFLE